MLPHGVFNFIRRFFVASVPEAGAIMAVSSATSLSSAVKPDGFKAYDAGFAQHRAYRTGMCSNACAGI